MSWTRQQIIGSNPETDYDMNQIELKAKNEFKAEHCPPPEPSDNQK